MPNFNLQEREIDAPSDAESSIENPDNSFRTYSYEELKRLVKVQLIAGIKSHIKFDLIK